jgi:hypothetical protein
MAWSTQMSYRASGRITQKHGSTGTWAALANRKGPSGNPRWSAKEWHSDVTAMASGTVHLHGYHISAPQCHEQLHKYRTVIIAHKA